MKDRGNAKSEHPLKSDNKRGISRAAFASRPKTLAHWLRDLGKTYGVRLMLMLVASQFVLKGFVMSYSREGFDWLLSARNVPGPSLQIYKSIGLLPFAMKPVIGMFSDAFPIFGYQKNIYIFITTLIGLSGLAILASSEFMEVPIRWLVVGLFCVITMVSSADVLTEAKYAERIRRAPEKGPDLITFVWFAVMGGGLIATLTLGHVLEILKPHWVYATCLIPAAVTLIPTLLNFMDEKKMSRDEVASVRTRYFAQSELVALVFLVGLASILIMVTGLMNTSVWVNLAVGLTCAFVVACAFLMLTAPIIGKMVVFGIIQHLCNFDTNGATFYFFTDGPEQYPEGPHFSPLFYISIVGVVGSVFGLLGVSVFNLYMKHWRYHFVFFTTNTLCALGHALSAIQFSRLNVRWGISDEVFATSYAMIHSLTQTMLFMPGMVLLTQLCPKNVEATMFALLAGTSNLGARIGGAVGAAVLTSFGVTPGGAPGESDKFQNLWLAEFISSIAPMITLIILPWMIPNALQTEQLMDESSTAVDGSPWRKFRSRRKDIVSSSPEYGAIA